MWTFIFVLLIVMALSIYLGLCPLGIVCPYLQVEIFINICDYKIHTPFLITLQQWNVSKITFMRFNDPFSYTIVDLARNVGSIYILSF